ncbi:MAG: hypothetical protein ACT4NX_09735 [Deltaproteobacteria bacterium]
MRYILSIAAAALVIFSLVKANFGDDQFTPDKLQAQFAESLKGSVSGVEGAEWKNHIDLWVKSSSADEKKAKNIASDVVIKGGQDLGQMFCVHVHKGDGREISKMCLTN